MYQLTFIIFFLLITLLTLRKNNTVRSAADFTTASSSLSFTGVSWVIVGTLIGGVSTIGTVQMAYTHGISACIFTFGSGLSCFVLGCFFARALREEGVVTVSEFLGRYFGERFQHYSSTINSLGMFIHVIGQFLASMAILQSIFGFGAVNSILTTLLLLGIFVVSGGISGAGLIGKIKFFMLYFIMVFCAGLALYKGGGLSEIISRLPEEQQMLNFSVYSKKNALVDLLSMVVGVLSTQIYLQAIFSAKNIKEARNGAFLSAAVVPPVGVLGLIIGLYLRGSFPELGANSAQALPFFIYHHFPPIIAASFAAGILLVVLGTGAGLVLGVTTNVYNDFLRSSQKLLCKVQPVTLLRLIALTILGLAAALVFTSLDAAILKWSYMSMGLRGAAVFGGLVVVVFFKEWCRQKWVVFALYLIPIVYIAYSLSWI